LFETRSPADTMGRFRDAGKKMRAARGLARGG
jgi:hypothetical protein